MWIHCENPDRVINVNHVTTFRIEKSSYHILVATNEHGLEEELAHYASLTEATMALEELARQIARGIILIDMPKVSGAVTERLLADQAKGS